MMSGIGNNLQWSLKTWTFWQEDVRRNTFLNIEMVGWRARDDGTRRDLLLSTKVPINVSFGLYILSETFRRMNGLSLVDGLAS